jgi:membrane fusion protein, multidrug efflux system
MQTRLSALIAAAVALAGCGNHQGSAAEEPPAVLVTFVVQRDVPLYREWVAQLNGSVNARISPKVSGYIIKRNYQEGYFVTKGQVLFEIDAGPLRAALDQGKATVAGAMANFGISKLNVARDMPLAQEKAIAQSQLDNDAPTLKANQAALDAAQRDAAEFAYRQSVRRAFADVANSLVGYRKSRALRLTLEEQTATYAETARLANDRYRGGSPVQLYQSLGGGWRP